jgi:hypothetical protein
MYAKSIHNTPWATDNRIDTNAFENTYQANLDDLELINAHPVA